jgi:hypothetical protein
VPRCRSFDVKKLADGDTAAYVDVIAARAELQHATGDALAAVRQLCALLSTATDAAVDKTRPLARRAELHLLVARWLTTASVNDSLGDARSWMPFDIDAADVADVGGVTAACVLAAHRAATECSPDLPRGWSMLADVCYAHAQRVVARARAANWLLPLSDQCFVDAHAHDQTPLDASQLDSVRAIVDSCRLPCESRSLSSQSDEQTRPIVDVAQLRRRLSTSLTFQLSSEVRCVCRLNRCYNRSSVSL